jgi:hypothetical protein
MEGIFNEFRTQGDQLPVEIHQIRIQILCLLLLVAHFREVRVGFHTAEKLI